MNISENEERRVPSFEEIPSLILEVQAYRRRFSLSSIAAREGKPVHQVLSEAMAGMSDEEKDAATL